MSESVSAVILAGGQGTRVNHLLPGLPKPMAPTAGRPFIEWIVRFLVGAGIEDIVLSTGHLGDVVAGHFAAHPVPGARVVCRREPGPLGTAGGFLHAIATHVSRPDFWFVLNGDSLALAKLSGFLNDVRSSGAAAGLLGVRVADASRFGTLEVDDDGCLIAFREKHPGAALVNAGIYLLPSWTAESLPARRPLSFETDVFPRLLGRSQTVRVYQCEVPFIDIGTPETLPLAADFVTQHPNFFP